LQRDQGLFILGKADRSRVIPEKCGLQKVETIENMWDRYDLQDSGRGRADAWNREFGSRGGATLAA
jgi:hypothetical protein